MRPSKGAIAKAWALTFLACASVPTVCWAFSQQSLPKNIKSNPDSSRQSNFRASGSAILRQANSNEDSDSMDSLWDEIEQMKKQALEKLNELESRTESSTVRVTVPAETETDTSVTANANAIEPKEPRAIMSSPPDLSTENENDYYEEAMAKRYESDSQQRSGSSGIKTENERIAVSNNPTIIKTTSSTSSPSPSSLLNPIRQKTTRAEELLDNTTWKLSLDIGREPGTWMPKDWGVSGERLKLNLDFTLTDAQLFEREEFLGSMGDAKILSVKNNEMILAPSITEGQRKIQIKNGGWRVVKGQGPMGTDLLRFYVEVEEEIKRNGRNSDTYCPKGRIYCNCGFFDMRRQVNGGSNAGMGEKARFRKRLDDQINRAEELDEEIANAGPFSFEGIKKNAELFRLKVDMQRTAESLASASVTEPDASILRFNRDGNAGLTKEGGVCCKVYKGVGLEYHILGRFYIQSSDK